MMKKIFQSCQQLKEREESFDYSDDDEEGEEDSDDESDPEPDYPNEVDGHDYEHPAFNWQDSIHSMEARPAKIFMQRQENNTFIIRRNKRGQLRITRKKDDGTIEQYELFSDAAEEMFATRSDEPKVDMATLLQRLNMGCMLSLTS